MLTDAMSLGSPSHSPTSTRSNEASMVRLAAASAAAGSGSVAASAPSSDRVSGGSPCLARLSAAAAARRRPLNPLSTCWRACSKQKTVKEEEEEEGGGLRELKSALRGSGVRRWHLPNYFPGAHLDVSVVELVRVLGSAVVAAARRGQRVGGHPDPKVGVLGCGLGRGKVLRQNAVHRVPKEEGDMAHRQTTRQSLVSAALSAHPSVAISFVTSVWSSRASCSRARGQASRRSACLPASASRAT